MWLAYTGFTLMQTQNYILPSLNSCCVLLQVQRNVEVPHKMAVKKDERGSKNIIDLILNR